MVMVKCYGGTLPCRKGEKKGEPNKDIKDKDSREIGYHSIQSGYHFSKEINSTFGVFMDYEHIGSHARK